MGIREYFLSNGVKEGLLHKYTYAEIDKAARDFEIAQKKKKEKKKKKERK